MPRPPHWIPFLAPVVAAGVGALVGRYGLDGGFWTVLISALVGGFAVIIGYRVWKAAHHKRAPQDDLSGI